MTKRDFKGHFQSGLRKTSPSYSLDQKFSLVLDSHFSGVLEFMTSLIENETFFVDDVLRSGCAIRLNSCGCVATVVQLTR